MHWFGTMERYESRLTPGLRYCTIIMPNGEKMREKQTGDERSEDVDVSG